MTDQLPYARLADNAAELFNSICEQHGGRAGLTTAQLEVVLVIVKLHADVRGTGDPLHRVRLLEAIGRAHALLPGSAVPAAAVAADGEQFTSDAAIAIHVVGSLSDDDLLALAAGLRTFSASNECLAALVERSVAVEGQLRDAQLAFSQKDFVRLNECLAHVPADSGRLDLVEALRAEVRKLEGLVDDLRSERVGPVYGKRAPGKAEGAREASPAGEHAPGASDAPRAAARSPAAIPSQSPGAPRAPLQAGQGDGVDMFAMGAVRGSQFDNRG
jgi:hypothetical protein